MKMITKRGIFLWILAVAFLFGLGFMTYSPKCFSLSPA